MASSQFHAEKRFNKRVHLAIDVSIWHLADLGLFQTLPVRVTQPRSGCRAAWSAEPVGPKGRRAVGRQRERGNR